MTFGHASQSGFFASEVSAACAVSHAAWSVASVYTPSKLAAICAVATASAEATVSDPHACVSAYAAALREISSSVGGVDGGSSVVRSTTM